MRAGKASLPLIIFLFGSLGTSLGKRASNPTNSSTVFRSRTILGLGVEGAELGFGHDECPTVSEDVKLPECCGRQPVERAHMKVCC